MIAEAEGVCILWAIGSDAALHGLGHFDCNFEIYCWHRELQEARNGSLSPPRDITTCREQGDHGRDAPISSQAIKTCTTHHPRQVRGKRECQSAPNPGLDKPHDDRRDPRRKLKSMYVSAKKMKPGCSTANYVADRLSKLDFFVMQEIFFQRDVPLRRCHPAGLSHSREGRHLPQHERRIQRLYEVFDPWKAAAPIGRSSRTSPTGWALDGSYEHPSQIYGRDCTAHAAMAGVTYERLEGYKTLQWPVAETQRSAPSCTPSSSISLMARRASSASRGRNRRISR